MGRRRGGEPTLQIEQSDRGFRIKGTGEVGVMIAALVGAPPLLLIGVLLLFGLGNHPWAVVSLSALILVGQIAAIAFAPVRMLDQRHEKEMAVLTGQDSD